MASDRKCIGWVEDNNPTMGSNCTSSTTDIPGILIPFQAPRVSNCVLHELRNSSGCYTSKRRGRQCVTVMGPSISAKIPETIETINKTEIWL